MNKKQIEKLYNSTGLNNNLNKDEVKKIVESQYEFTKETIDKLSLRDIAEEEFNKLKTNFIYKYFGKLYTTYGIINRYSKKKK